MRSFLLGTTTIWHPKSRRQTLKGAIGIELIWSLEQRGLLRNSWTRCGRFYEKIYRDSKITRLIGELSSTGIKLVVCLLVFINKKRQVPLARNL